MSTTDFFMPLDNEKPYVKIAFEGFAGTGKSLTAAFLAIGIHQRIDSKKPIVLFDTERAAKFLRPAFDEAKITAVVKASRSLADLKKTMELCRQGYSDVVLIDSLSHVWENFVEGYKNRPDSNGKPKKRDKLEMLDWGIIKPLWKKEFADPFVLDPYHCIFTGRAGYEYESEINEKGKREFYKAGVKMKVEGETAYEPDILVLMERFEEILGEDKKVWREATVIKDRSRILDGRTFRNPTYESFAPAVEMILKDPTVRRNTPEADVAALIKTEEDHRGFLRQRDIALEKIEAFMVQAGYGGQAAEARKHKIAALTYAFGTASWTEISGKTPPVLNHGLELLRAYVRADAAGELPKLLAGEPAAQEPIEPTVIPDPVDPGPCSKLEGCVKPEGHDGVCAIVTVDRVEDMPDRSAEPPPARPPAEPVVKKSRSKKKQEALGFVDSIPKALCVHCGGRDGNHTRPDCLAAPKAEAT